MADDPEQPPVFRTWRSWYILVTGFLLLQILLFTLLTKSCA
jgi:hypothetical protein